MAVLASYLVCWHLYHPTFHVFRFRACVLTERHSNITGAILTIHIFHCSAFSFVVKILEVVYLNDLRFFTQACLPFTIKLIVKTKRLYGKFSRNVDRIDFQKKNGHVPSKCNNTSFNRNLCCLPMLLFTLISYVYFLLKS